MIQKFRRQYSGNYGKIVFTILLLLVSFSAAPQSRKYIGKIIEKGSKTPVAGVYILQNNIPVTFTDLNGVFMIKAQAMDTLCIRHLIYKQIRINCAELGQDTNYIIVENSIFELPEIQINIENTRSIIKKACKLFQKHYRSYSFWAKSHYHQLVSYQGKYRSYIECSGYTFFPALNQNIYSGQVCQIPFEIRRSREDSVLTQAWKEKGRLLISPVFVEYGGDFPFLEYIHPLGKFHHREYFFRKDTLENHQDMVILFKQKSNGFDVGGWRINRCSGKLYLDPQTYQLKKMVCLFYKTDKLNQIEIDYCKKSKNLFLQNVKMEYTYIENPLSPSDSKTFIDSEYHFSEIDTTRRPDYKELTLNYMFQSAIMNLPYHPSFWQSYPLQGKWKEGMQELCPDQNMEEEFRKGSQQNLFNKTHKYYFYISSAKHLQKQKQFIGQLKKDLNIP